MRGIETLKLIAGACVVYAAISACSGTAGDVDLYASPPGAGDGGPQGGADAVVSGSGDAVSGTGTGTDGPGPDAPTQLASDAATDPQSNGSRLKAAYYVGGDGSRQFAHWVDTARNNESCSFQPASDGVTRCLPPFQYTQSFADAQCTRPLLAVGSGCAAPTSYVMTFDGTVTCQVVPLQPLYAVTSTTATTLFLKSGTSCIAEGLSPGVTYFLAGSSAIPPASFQDAQVQTL